MTITASQVATFLERMVYTAHENILPIMSKFPRKGLRALPGGAAIKPIKTTPMMEMMMPVVCLALNLSLRKTAAINAIITGINPCNNAPMDAEVYFSEKLKKM